MANDPHSFASAAHHADGGGFALSAGMVLGGKYRLVRPAGFGGMGVVWVARNEATQADVAVKVLVLSRQGVDDETIARFRREAHAAAHLSHRGIVRVFDLLELEEPEEALVIVMELLRGETLGERLESRGAFTLDETLDIAGPVLSALGYAHAQGIVHRDLKPENIFLVVEPDGHVLPKILDFGISKMTQPQAPKITTDGAMLGTPSYMSPEQARGQADVDARADVFSCGIVLYEMLAGQSPFASASYHSVVAAILEREPAPLPTLPDPVWRVLRRALEKPAELRYADAQELGSALERAARSVGAVAPGLRPDASGAFSALTPRLSLGDRSVPPAAREQEPTVPSLRAAARKRGRLVGMSLGLVALGAALGVTALLTRGRFDSVPTSRASAAVVDVPRPAPPSAEPTAPVAVAPSASAIPMAVSPLPDPSSVASATAGRPHPVTHAPPPPHAPKAPASASAAPTPAAPSAKSTVVHDPGF